MILVDKRSFSVVFFEKEVITRCIFILLSGKIKKLFYRIAIIESKENFFLTVLFCRFSYN